MTGRIPYIAFGSMLRGVGPKPFKTAVLIEKRTENILCVLDELPVAFDGTLEMR